MELDSKPPAEIVIERPTGPRITASEPLSLGQLVAAKASKASKSVVSAAVVGASAGLAFLTRHKFAVGLGASTVTAIATHLIVASMMMGMVGDRAAPVVASYTGPGDLSLSGVQAWWGLRAFSAATRGTAAINLCDNSGANCSDEVTDATTGDLIVGTHGANNCATSDTCHVATVYDQSGANSCSSAACNMTQGTDANRPTLKHNCLNTNKFCLVFNGSSQFLTNTTAFTSSLAEHTMVGVGYSNTAQFGSYLSSASGGAPGNSMLAWGPNGFLFNNNGGSVSTSNTDAAWHSVQAYMKAATPVIGVNADDTNKNSATPGSTTNFGGTMDIGNDVSSHFLAGRVTEMGVWNFQFTAGNQTTMCHNQYSYWATSVSC